MPIVFSGVAPHPPILVPEIGRDNLTDIKATKTAMDKFRVACAESKPETLVFISPHSPAFADAFAVKTEQNLEGSFAQFGAPSVEAKVKNDVELAKAIISKTEKKGISAVELSKEQHQEYEVPTELDHGMLVPYYYLKQSLDVPVVSLSISHLDYLKHYDQNTLETIEKLYIRDFQLFGYRMLGTTCLDSV